METQVISEAIQAAIGDRRVQQLVFCTHDLDPEFFEQEVLPVFIGNGSLRHNRRVREVQMDYVIRQDEIGIDVYYEARALAAHEGSARLGWNRHKRTGKRGGVFHPKVVLVLCKDASSGTESLIVGVLSANLTRAGWWYNVECGDIEVIEDGVRHNFVEPLRRLIQTLLTTRRRAGGQSPAPATDAIKAFLRRQTGFKQQWSNGQLRPQLLAGDNDLVRELRGLFGKTLNGAHLEIISPFFDGDARDVTARIKEFKADFSPQTVRVALPIRSGQTTVSQEIFDAVAELPGVHWALLPKSITAAARGDSANERGLHAKVYRFWRGGKEPIEVIVSGSHNLTEAALSGERNWEVSVVRQTTNIRPSRFLLENEVQTPSSFLCSDDDLESEIRPSDISLSLAFDWATKQATAIWTGRNRPKSVTVSRAGATICRINLESPNTKHVLPRGTTTALRKTLMRSCLVSVRTEDGREGPLLIEELNHDRKPDLFEGLELTPAEVFALWSLPDLRARVSTLADAKSSPAHDEDDFEWAGAVPSTAPSMFEQFAGVFHAFNSLRRRIDGYVEAKKEHQAGLAMYAEKFDSPIYALKLVEERADEDLPLAYVTYSCARLLDDYVHQSYPQVSKEMAPERAALKEQFRFRQDIRKRLIAAPEDEDMAKFLDWFDKRFKGKASR